MKNYSNNLKNFSKLLKVPIERATKAEVLKYIDFLLSRGLKPTTVNSYLNSLSGFCHYLRHEEGINTPNPVKAGYALRLPSPLPRFLLNEDIAILFDEIKNCRDEAMFRLMLRCGLRVEEVAHLTLGAIDLQRRRITVKCGKWCRDRIVFMSDDAFNALSAYLDSRSRTRVKRVFLVEKGTFKDKPLSVRGIQKRIEYYAKKTGVQVSCHRLRHTMATQLLNADAEAVTIQDLLGHNCLASTQRYCKVSNPKVRRDYFKAMELVLQQTS
ncbi:MAG: tyrosine-type recombinase/integrase [Deltaproteobacteria bacterium]|nr:tyrosine-type recombinase/integrase [Deltaproteobacteria bacterium]